MATNPTQFAFNFDHTKRPRRRTLGLRRVAETSVDAFERVRTNPLAISREDVFEAVKREGVNGLTLLEFVFRVNQQRRANGVRGVLAPNDVSGRFTELGDEEPPRLVRVMRADNPDKRLTRDGAGVWRAAEVIQ